MVRILVEEEVGFGAKLPRAGVEGRGTAPGDKVIWERMGLRTTTAGSPRPMEEENGRLKVVEGEVSGELVGTRAGRYPAPTNTKKGKKLLCLSASNLISIFFNVDESTLNIDLN